jgi:hypothetical protein
MTNRIALFLALVILVAIVADVVLNQAEASLFLARKLVVLIDWVMFWR